MPNLRQLRRRIRTVQNAGKVTHAMEMVAASKMRRAQNAVLAGRPYAEKIQQVVADLASQPQEEESVNALLQRRLVSQIEVLHLTPDRGLCGGLNSNLNRMVAQFILQQQPVPVSVIAVGRKGRDFMIRYGQEVKAIFLNLGDRPSLADTLPISHVAIADYTSGFADEVYLAYAQFISTASQQPVVRRLLPLEPAELPTEARVGYIYEPRSSVVLESLLPRFVEMQVYHVLLELIASEQSARMVAMRNATENASEMVTDLTLELNKARQESITNELLDIVGGTVALEG